MSDFYTVSQFAQVSGKDPGNIRRLLINGELAGEKVGNQWLIPRNAAYPADRRVKSGEYRNWRQRVNLNSRHPEIIKGLYGMCETLGEIYGDSIAEIVLYGSYARGRESDESDVDIALILKTEQTEAQYDRMTDAVVDYQLDFDITLSVVSIDRNEYLKWKTVLPFYKNIAREGIVLWKSA